jgi:23S rRNA pseudouridine1911/1915/1917 synthase
MRPGIVHRLDKDTSGVMVVAKSEFAHHYLVDQFKERLVEKLYRAIVVGKLLESCGTVDRPIGRHPVNRKKMSIRDDGRRAVTHWQVLERFDGYTYVELNLETGRTHQIRLHLASLGHPVAGDAVYGKKMKHDPQLAIKRQCLHAFRLGFIHPRSGKKMRFEAPLWPDMEATLQCLRQSATFKEAVGASA